MPNKTSTLLNTQRRASASAVWWVSCYTDQRQRACDTRGSWMRFTCTAWGVLSVLLGQTGSQTRWCWCGRVASLCFRLWWVRHLRRMPDRRTSFAASSVMAALIQGRDHMVALEIATDVWEDVASEAARRRRETGRRVVAWTCPRAQKNSVHFDCTVIFILATDLQKIMYSFRKI